MIRWEWQIDGSCVACGQLIPDQGVCICRSCRRVCRVTMGPASPSPVPEDSVYALLDVKSECCGADVDVQTKVTCSDTCHEVLVADIERKFGAEKIVVDIATGRKHRVPTRVLIERGLRTEELPQYPEAFDG